MAEAKHEPTFGSDKRLISTLTISENPSEVFVVRYSPDGKFLATGCGDGAIRIFNAVTGKLSYNLNVGNGAHLPCTALRWRPPTAASKTKNVLVAVGSDGTLQHWHATSGRCLHATVEEGNQLLCVDFRPDGEMFATAGKDKAVRIYDEATKARVATLQAGLGSSSPGHSNRVFSLKFSDTDPNLVASAGWDNTVQIWDLRVEHSVRHIFGPHVCGDAMDVLGDRIVTGSWRPEKQLQVWDLGTAQLVEDIPWPTSRIADAGPCMLYAAQFSRGAGRGLIAAGGSGANEARVFDTTRRNALVGTVSGLSRGVFSLDFSPQGDFLALAGGDSAVRVLKVHSMAGEDGEGKRGDDDGDDAFGDARPEDDGAEGKGK